MAKSMKTFLDSVMANEETEIDYLIKIAKPETTLNDEELGEAFNIELGYNPINFHDKIRTTEFVTLIIDKLTKVSPTAAEKILKEKDSLINTVVDYIRDTKHDVTIEGIVDYIRLMLDTPLECTSFASVMMDNFDIDVDDAYISSDDDVLCTEISEDVDDEFNKYSLTDDTDNEELEDSEDIDVEDE